jgi:hypothetical protein
MPEMPYTKILILQALLYTTIGALTPTITVLAGDTPLTSRSIIALVVVSIVAGATALKAFLSTAFSDEQKNGKSQPDNSNVAFHG